MIRKFPVGLSFRLIKMQEMFILCKADIGTLCFFIITVTQQVQNNLKNKVTNGV